MSTVKLTYKAKIKHIFHRVSTVYNTSLISIANTHFLNKTLHITWKHYTTRLIPYCWAHKGDPHISWYSRWAKICILSKTTSDKFILLTAGKVSTAMWSQFLVWCRCMECTHLVQTQKEFTGFIHFTPN